MLSPVPGAGLWQWPKVKIPRPVELASQRGRRIRMKDQYCGCLARESELGDSHVRKGDMRGRVQAGG